MAPRLPQPPAAAVCVFRHCPTGMSGPHSDFHSGVLVGGRGVFVAGGGAGVLDAGGGAEVFVAAGGAEVFVAGGTGVLVAAGTSVALGGGPPVGGTALVPVGGGAEALATGVDVGPPTSVRRMGNGPPPVGDGPSVGEGPNVEVCVGEGVAVGGWGLSPGASVLVAAGGEVGKTSPKASSVGVASDPPPRTIG